MFKALSYKGRHAGTPVPLKVRTYMYHILIRNAGSFLSQTSSVQLPPCETSYCYFSISVRPTSLFSTANVRFSEKVFVKLNQLVVAQVDLSDQKRLE